MKKTKTVKKTPAVTKKPAPAAEQTLVVFLLDRTGSMENVRQETISGFNTYRTDLLKKPDSKHITFYFAQFDTQSLDVIHDCIPLADVVPLSMDTYIPRAMTPLYDSIGKTIRAIEEKAKGSKVLFVTLTDGNENASREWTSASIKTLIKHKEDADKWTFAYIGVGQEAWAQNEQLAAGTQGASNVLRATRGANTQAAYGHMAKATMMRTSTKGGQCISACFAGVQLDQEDEH